MVSTKKTALRAVYRLVGWDDLDLPRERIADLHIGTSGKTHDPKEFYRYFSKYLPGLMTMKYHRGKLLNMNGLPSYQTVFPFYWGRELTAPLMEEIMAQGHDGYFFEISAEPFVKSRSRANGVGAGPRACPCRIEGAASIH